MNLLSKKLTQSIRQIKSYRRIEDNFLFAFQPLLQKRYPTDQTFLKSFENALAYHVTGDVFSERTINALFVLVNQFERPKLLSPLLRKLIRQMRPLVHEVFLTMEKEIELSKMKASYEPLQSHSENLQKQLRRLIVENMELIKSNETLKGSVKHHKKLNAGLEMRLNALEQEAKILRAQNGGLSRMLRAFKKYLGMTMSTFSPELFERVKQLYLFKDEANSFDEVSRAIEIELRELLNCFQADVTTESLALKDESIKESDMDEAQQKLLEKLSVIWHDISSEAKRERAFCAIVETIKCMFDQKQQHFKLDLLYKMSPTLQNRYFVLKEGLYREKQASGYHTKPFFSTKDAAKSVDTSLLEKSSEVAENFVVSFEKYNPEQRSDMSLLLDEFFTIIKKLLANHHAELHDDVEIVAPHEPVHVIAAAPAA